ncbi:MAG TPA: hypothetical protein VFW03_18095 [Gemmatimonadaceae bacterium]|nr:hypothetical protein [Gemmatimonadaceae bacterium]
MRIDLTDDEVHTLGTMLRDYLPSLRWEVARTDQHTFRHELIKRQELCERLLEVLEKVPH